MRTYLYLYIVRAAGDFDDLKIAELAAIDGETDEGTDVMPALEAGSTRIDVEELELGVVLHLQDMAVTANEELGGTGKELVADAPVVTTRVTTDVGHQHVGSFARPAQQFGKHAAEVAAIAVADDGSKGTERGEAVGELHTTDVAGVPDLVALAEVLQVLVVPETMGITQQTNAL